MLTHYTLLFMQQTTWRPGTSAFRKTCPMSVLRSLDTKSGESTVRGIKPNQTCPGIDIGTETFWLAHRVPDAGYARN